MDILLEAEVHLSLILSTMTKYESVLIITHVQRSVSAQDESSTGLWASA